MRKIRKYLRKPALIAFSAFFDPAYLKGKYFEQSYGRFRWALRTIWQRNFLRLAPPLPFPAALTCVISDAKNIAFDPEDLNIFQTGGTYFQNFSALISIGKGTWIAPNVGIITANHDPLNPDEHLAGADIRIGRKCWIGMNSVILPGVTLGDHTVVGAGSVVTRSFEQGHCVIGGSPARLIRELRHELSQ